MALILTAEDVVRRIAAECAYVDERGGVGIRLEPAAAIVRRYGEQFRAPRRPRRPRVGKTTAPTLISCWLVLLLHQTYATKSAFDINGLTLSHMS